MPRRCSRGGTRCRSAFRSPAVGPEIVLRQNHQLPLARMCCNLIADCAVDLTIRSPVARLLTQIHLALHAPKGRVTSPKRMNFRKSSKQPLELFRKFIRFGGVARSYGRQFKVIDEPVTTFVKRSNSSRHLFCLKYLGSTPLNLLVIKVCHLNHLGHMFGSSRLVGEAVSALPIEPARPRTPNLGEHS